MEGGRVPLVVGLTGALGSGKSTALQMFSRLGAVTISTDAIAHELTRRGGRGVAAVARRFGRGVLAADGSVDRAALARRVFQSGAERRALERMLHPLIMEEVRRRARGRRGVVVVEVPLLFEAGLEKQFDVSVALDAPRPALLRRSGLPPAEARRRLAAQMSPAEKARRADVVLDNSDGRNALEKGVRELYRAFALMAGART